MEDKLAAGGENENEHVPAICNSFLELSSSQKPAAHNAYSWKRQAKDHAQAGSMLGARQILPSRRAISCFRGTSGIRPYSEKPGKYIGQREGKYNEGDMQSLI